MDLPITLDQRSETPLHKQLYDELRRAILTGRLKPGERVPSTRGLSLSLGVSRTTVTQSYEQLLSEGYLRAETGSGTFVGCELPDELLKTLPVEKFRPAVSSVSSGSAGASEESCSRRAERQIELSCYGASITEDGPFDICQLAEGPMNFSSNRPALNEFPLRDWRRLTLKHYRAKDPSMLNYTSLSL